jgi:hypothetical protein
VRFESMYLVSPSGITVVAGVSVVIGRFEGIGKEP